MEERKRKRQEKIITDEREGSRRKGRRTKKILKISRNYLKRKERKMRNRTRENGKREKKTHTDEDTKMKSKETAGLECINLHIKRKPSGKQ